MRNIDFYSERDKRRVEELRGGRGEDDGKLYSRAAEVLQVKATGEVSNRKMWKEIKIKSRR